MPFISTMNRITLWPSRLEAEPDFVAAEDRPQPLQAAGAECDNHRTWRRASKGLLCPLIGKKTVAARKPESERAL